MARIDTGLRQAHPEEPWKWRRDWLEGRIGSADAASAVVVSILAGTFTAFSIPLLLSAPELATREGPAAVGFAAILPLASLGLVVWAARATLRWRRFRGICFELETRPGSVGGQLRGTLHLPGPLPIENGVHARLVCVRRRVRRRGKRRDVSEDVVWDEERRVARHELLAGPTGTSLPLAFAVPFEAPPSSPEPGRDVHVWRLHVEASLGGIDLASVFEVPIFRTADSATSVTETISVANDEKAQVRTTQATDVDDLLAGFADPCARVAFSPDRKLEICFLARRNRVGAIALFLFSLVWNGALIAALDVATSTFAWLLAPFFAVGAGMLALSLLVAVHTLRIRVDASGIHTAHHLLGLRVGGQHVPAAEIRAVAPRASGQQGGRARWGLKLDLRDGSARKLGDGLRGKRDAERLAGATAGLLRRPLDAAAC